MVDGTAMPLRLGEGHEGGEIPDGGPDGSSKFAPFGRGGGAICAYTDSDWAGCHTARKPERRSALYRRLHGQVLVINPEHIRAIFRRGAVVSASRFACMWTYTHMRRLD